MPSSRVHEAVGQIGRAHALAVPYGPTFGESTAYESSKNGTGWLIVMTRARAPWNGPVANVQFW